MSLILSYERQLISKLNIETEFSNPNKNDIFLLLLNNPNISVPIKIYFLNKFLPYIQIFNDICVKYFQILLEEFKSKINKLQSKDNISLLTSLNALANFIKLFSKNQEKYNEKHKIIIKQFPQFIQLLFKLFEQKYFNFNDKVINSFLLLFLSFIEFYPTLIRNYQKIIEKSIKNIFVNYLTQNTSDKNSIEIAIVVYCNLYKLSPNMILRYNDYIDNIIKNIKYYLEFFRPKNINEEEINRNIIDEKNNLFFEENNIFIIDNKKIVNANKIINILFDLLNEIFKYLINDVYFDIDFNIIFSLFNNIMDLYESFNNNKSLSVITFNGLSKYNYEIFITNIIDKILDLLIYYISNFSRYIYCYNVFFEKFINKILLNQNLFENFFLHKKIILFLSSIISYFNDILPDTIDLIIFKHLYSNLPILYLNYLQENDKTLLEVNDIYFRASNLKNKIYNNKKEENHILLIQYLHMLYNFCQISSKFLKINNKKNILGGIIDLLILPPFAKFIFNIEEDIKDIIIDIIEICSKKNLVYINKSKLISFLNNFYFFNGNYRNKAINIINLINIKDSELNNNEFNDNIIGNILDFNKKIKEYLIESSKKFENILLDNNNKDNNNININENEIIQEKKEGEMLRKKRKNKKEYEIQIDYNKNMEERKGNKKKNDRFNLNSKKEFIKKEDNNLDKMEEENIEINHNEEENKKNKNEDIQIDENIDIPDII